LFINKLSIDEVIEKHLDNTTDETLRKIKRLIIQESSKFWQWNNNKRYFFDDTTIYFPNGVQAKENTHKLTI